MLAGLDRQETHKRNLHAGQGSQGIPGRVRNIQPGAIASHADKDKGVEGEKAGNEGITTPRGNHITVEQSTESPPKHRPLLQSLDPQIKGKDEKENSNGFVVVAASN